MKRPLVRLALVYGGGLQLADTLPLPLWPLLLLTLLTGMIALLRPALRSILLPMSVALLGASNLVQDTAPHRPHDVRNLTVPLPHDVSIRGRLISVQQTQKADSPAEGRTTAELQARFLRLGAGSWQPAWGGVMIFCPELLDVQRGSEVEVRGVLNAPGTPRAPGLFDYRRHLQRQGVYRVLHTQGQENWRALSDAPAPITLRVRTWAQRTLARGLPAEDPAVGLLWAMALGWRSGLRGEISEPFMRSGTLHVFAISGLHVLLITGLLTALLRFFRVPRPICAAFLLPTLWFYAAVAEWQPSAVRSILMTSVVLLGWLLHRPGDLLNSLAAAGLLLLLWEPQQLFQVGFQLSFAVVLSLILLDAVLEPARRAAARPDPMLPSKHRSRLTRTLEDLRRHLATAAKTSVAAWLGSLAIVAFYFHYFTPVSLLANLLIVPLSGLALGSALGSLLTGGWVPAVSELFNHSAWFWMRSMMALSQWCASLPGAWFHVAWPGLFSVALYYTVLAGFATGWFGRPITRPAIVATTALLSACAFAQWHQQNAPIRLTLLPAGGGTAIHFRQPGFPRDLLIDCGSADAVPTTMGPYLRAQGIDRLPILALTHGDQRHVSGASLLAEQIPIEQLCLGPTRFRSPAYRAIEDAWSSTGRLRRVQPGQRIGPWEVLHPSGEDRFGRADDAALVLLGQLHQTRVLLCSDLGRAGQRKLLERWPGLGADILVCGVPNAEEGLSPLFIEALRPGLIIVADTLLPADRRAARGFQKRLSAQPIPVVYTHETGALTLIFSPRRPCRLVAANGKPVSF